MFLNSLATVVWKPTTVYGLFLLSQKSMNKLKETHVNTSTTGTYSFSFGKKTQMDIYDVK